MLDYVNAHGTGTVLNDAMEASALSQALGDEVRRIPVSSCKGQIGHTLGASGAIEAVVSVLAVARGEIPPTGGLEEPDAACELVHVMGRGRRAPVRAALSSSFGFGGTDTVLVFTRTRLGRALDSASASRRVVVTGAAIIGPLGLSRSRASREYLTPGPSPLPDMPPFEPNEYFDAARARRLDRPARLLTLALQQALAEASPSEGSTLDYGAIGGSAYGSVDASAAFVQRIFEKGARLAVPMTFPNLVPSSPVGHAAIYLGLQGPVLATADLGITGESAVVLACELIEAGESSDMLAGSVEERSLITERVLGPVCAGTSRWRGVRTEGATAVALEDEEYALARGATPLCRVAHFATGRGVFAGEDPVPHPIGPRSLVVVARRDEETLLAVSRTAWAGIDVIEVAARAGNHESVGGFAVACAAGALASREADEILVVGVAPDRWALLVLTVP